MKKIMLISIGSLVIIVLAAFLFFKDVRTSNNGLSFCQERELSNFDMKVDSKEKAVGLFKIYISEQNELAPFNESLVRGPDEIIDSVLIKKGIYVYRDHNGIHDTVLYLYPNGKLIYVPNCK